MNATALVNSSIQLPDGAAAIRSAREARPAAGAGESFSASLTAQQQAMSASASEPTETAPSPRSVSESVSQPAPHSSKPSKAKASKQDGTSEQDAAADAAVASPQQAAVPQDQANTGAADAGESAARPRTGTLTGTQAGQPMPETGKDLPPSLPALEIPGAGIAVPSSAVNQAPATTSPEKKDPGPILPEEKSPREKPGVQASLDSASGRLPPKVGDVLAALLGDVKPQAAPVAPTGNAAVALPAASAPAVSDKPSSVTPGIATPNSVTPTGVTPSAAIPNVGTPVASGAGTPGTGAPGTGTPGAGTPGVMAAAASDASTQASADASFLRVSLSSGGRAISAAHKPDPGPVSFQTAPSQPMSSQAGGAHDKSIEGLVLSVLTTREGQQSSGKEGAATGPVLQNVAGPDRPAALDTAVPGTQSAAPTAVMPGGAVPESRPVAVASTAQPPISVPIDHESWAKALGQHMVGMLQSDVQHAELRLRPPELGSLEVRIALSQDQASVAFASPHGVVREALEAAVPRLRQMFAETGINLIDVNVSQHSFSQHPQREQGGLAPYAAASPVSAPLPDASIPSATSVSPLRRLVDYYA